MSRTALVVLGLIVVVGVGWYLSLGDAPVAPAGTVVVSFEVKYKGDGSFNKVKVRSSNGGIFKPSRGHICYDPDPSLCHKPGEDWQLTWTGEKLKAGERVEIAVKDPMSCNSGIVAPATLTSGQTDGPHALIAPVAKQGGSYCPWVYKVTVFKDDVQIGIEDPDIMPHGPPH